MRTFWLPEVTMLAKRTLGQAKLVYGVIPRKTWSSKGLNFQIPSTLLAEESSLLLHLLQAVLRSFSIIQSSSKVLREKRCFPHMSACLKFDFSLAFSIWKVISFFRFLSLYYRTNCLCSSTRTSKTVQFIACFYSFLSRLGFIVDARKKQKFDVGLKSHFVFALVFYYRTNCWYTRIEFIG